MFIRYLLTFLCKSLILYISDTDLALSELIFFSR